MRELFIFDYVGIVVTGGVMGEREPGMIHDSLSQHEQYEDMRGNYAEYESLDSALLERFLEQGEIRNIAPIEALGQPVSEHKDAVYTGSMVKAHKDAVFEGELILPDFDKPLLVVCKPDSGVNEGSYLQESRLSLHHAASPGSNKEAAAWLLARELGKGRLLEPTVRRPFSDGDGSIRPYIWGRPLDLVTIDEWGRFYDDEEAMADMAYLDYFLQPADRKNANMMQTLDGRPKLIDHTLTFWDDRFIRTDWISGPRLVVAYDNKNGNALRRTPLPERLQEDTETAWERRNEIAHVLSTQLKDWEIEETVRRIGKMRETNIFM